LWGGDENILKIIVGDSFFGLFSNLKDYFQANCFGYFEILNTHMKLGFFEGGILNPKINI